MMGSVVSQSAAIWDRRIRSLRDAVGRVDVSHPAGADPLIAVSSSRLGHDSRLHRNVCQFLCRSLLDCRHRGASLLVASGSAIEPWAVRAAELFAVPLIRLSVNRDDQSAEIVVRSRDGAPLSRDAAVIGLADRVDAVYVRSGGTIERCLRQRVNDRRDASTRVAVAMTETCAAADLIAAGAIGWFRSTACEDRRGVRNAIDLEGQSCHATPRSDSWTRTDGKWLIHCTRGRPGAWPGETERQFRDSILLGDESSQSRQPLDALTRIVRCGRIIAGATATSKKHPVVCFSSLPLVELLHRRCFRPHLGRWDYEPYGIAISMTAARRLGIQPVIYGQTADRATLAPADRFRFHPIGTTFDWRGEREWRSGRTVDLCAVAPGDVRVFAEDLPDSRTRLRDCHWSVTFVPVRAVDFVSRDA
jgi:hypothetical protein